MKPRLSRLSLLLLSQCLAFATNAAAAISCPDKPIKLAFYHYGLLYFESPAGQARGIDRDLVDVLAQRSGCKFQTLLQTRARIWMDLEAGWLDMSVSGIETEERARFAWFIPYLVMKNQLVTHAELAPKFHSLADFQYSSYRLGVVRSFRHGQAQDALISALRKENRVVESRDANASFIKLHEGKIDAMFSQSLVYTKYLKDLNLSADMRVLDLTPEEVGVPHGLILSKQRFSAADAEQWRALMHELRADGSLRKIFRRYVDEAEAERLLRH